MGGDGGNCVLKGARVVAQREDGSCLYHSLAHGLRSVPGMSYTADGRALRRELADWVSGHPDYLIENPVKDWVQWDTGESVKVYAARMGQGRDWGGGIEMVACTREHHVNVHVYEEEVLPKTRGRTQQPRYVRISCFNVRGAKATLRVLYRGRNHYDALVGGTDSQVPPKPPRRKQSANHKKRQLRPASAAVRPTSPRVQPPVKLTKRQQEKKKREERQRVASALANNLVPGHRYSSKLIIQHHQADMPQGIKLSLRLLADLKKHGKAFCAQNHIYHGFFGCVTVWMLSNAGKNHELINNAGTVSSYGLSDPMPGPSLLANKLHTKKKKKTSKQGLW